MSSQTNDVNVIPWPASVERSAGSFELSSDSVIVDLSTTPHSALHLRELLAPATGYSLPIRGTVPDGTPAIVLETSPPDQELGSEGYSLIVTPEAVRIQAPEAAGLFYGVQTLRQLLPHQIERDQPVAKLDWMIPCLAIRDRPRFAWRGYMLDEARHFQGKETVLDLLDLLALHKLNRFHWHLTDDQGWRIEITRYPRLTEIGSRRSGTMQRWIGRPDDIPHEGHYSQADIREIVDYAAERHITVVPEIEMPGHSMAALAAYPELGCTGGPFEVATRFGVIQDILCGGSDHVVEFLENVLTEVMELFPSPYIHIGGDEAPKARWKACARCQERIRQEGLRDEDDLQTHLTNHMAAFLSQHGRRLIGWNEILDEGLSQDAIVQHWIRNRSGVVDAIYGGRDVIVSAYFDMYLDHSYTLLPLRRAYRFEPVYRELESQEVEHVLGLEAPLWTEWVPDRARLDYQTWPRLSAFAETGWTMPERKNLRDFRRRLRGLFARMDELGVLYAPEKDWEPPWYKRLFGFLSIARRKTATARQSST